MSGLPSWIIAERARLDFFAAYGRQSVVVVPPFDRVKLMMVLRRELGISLRTVRWLVPDQGAVVTGTPNEMCHLVRCFSAAGIVATVESARGEGEDAPDLAHVILADSSGR